MKTLINFFRPSPWLGYLFVVCGIVFGTTEGWIRLWGGHAYDDALAYGLAVGLAVIFGIFVAVWAIYVIALAFGHYLRAISTRSQRTRELLGLPPRGRKSSSKVSSVIRTVLRVVVYGCAAMIAAGVTTFSVVVCRLVILLVVGFPDWKSPLFLLVIGLAAAVLVSGLFLGFLYCYLLDQLAKRLQSRAVANLNETAIAERVADGSEVVATVEKGERLVGKLAGRRREALSIT